MMVDVLVAAGIALLVLWLALAVALLIMRPKGALLRERPSGWPLI